MPKLAVAKSIRNSIIIRPMKEGTEVSKIEAHQTAWPALCICWAEDENGAADICWAEAESSGTSSPPLKERKGRLWVSKPAPF